MKGHIFKPKCTCKDKSGNSLSTKKCKCGASWAYIVDIGVNPLTGNRKQKKKSGFKTKTEAQENLALLLSEISSGTFVEERNTVFNEYALVWLHEYQKTGKVKPGTVRIRKHEISKLTPYMGKLKLKNITKNIYQNALYSLKDKGFADNTMDGIHRVARMLFKRAVETGIIKNDPTATATVPKSILTIEQIENKKQIPKYLEKEDLGVLLTNSQSIGLEQDYTIFRLLSYTGIRVGELCALKWSDVSFNHLTIRITKTYYNPTNNIKNFILVTPKTRSSIREISIDSETLNVLKNHLIWQKKIKQKYSNTYLNDHFIFTITSNKNIGYPIYIKLIENRMHRLLKLSKLNTTLTPHSLRHTHTSLLAEVGVSLETIMDRLGHSDDETTKLIYLHITKPKKIEASQKFEELMRNLLNPD